jgi:hypothetical protein
MIHFCLGACSVCNGDGREPADAMPLSLPTLARILVFLGTCEQDAIIAWR